jgi:hypothetical protein
MARRFAEDGQAAAETSAAEQNVLIGFHGGSEPQAWITPAPRWRDWMNAMPERWANRCLPLLVANEAGWTLLNPAPFEATWSGAPETDAVQIEFPEGRPPKPLVASLFGFGIVTWTVPYLFRTPPGYNLLARGPANWPKDGICALEGLVETDWSVATFTMNWKLTRPNHVVRFDEGEPFCMVLPQRRGELESFRPEIRELASEPELEQASGTWAKRRHELAVRKFLGEFSPAFADDSWEAHYFKGLTPDGAPAPEHQTHLRLHEFSGFNKPDTQDGR